MSSLDLLVLGHIVHHQNFEMLEVCGGSEEDFKTTIGQALYRIIHSYYNNPATRGSTPSIDFLRTHYPQLTLPETGNIPLKELVANLRAHRVVLEARTQVDKLKQVLNDTYNPDIGAVLSEAAESFYRLITLSAKGTDSDLEEGFSGVVRLYEDMRSGRVTYMPWPWPEMREWSPGIKPEDFIVLYGRPKNKKTFVLLYFAFRAWLSGGKVLLYSKEMSVEEIWQRVIAFMCNLLLDDLSLAKMDLDSENRLYEMQAEVLQRKVASNGTNNIVCISGLDAPGGCDSVSWLAGKVRQHQPTLVVVDGLYLMAGPSKAKDRHERVGAISTALRAMALQMHIPVVATVQANRKVGNKAALEMDSDLEDVAFSDDLARDATVLIRVVADRTFPTASLLFSGARSINLAGISINAVPCTDFSWIGPIDRRQATEARNMDDASSVEDPPSQPSPPADLPKPRKRGKKRESPDPMTERMNAELLSYEPGDPPSL